MTESVVSAGGPYIPSQSYKFLPAAGAANVFYISPMVAFHQGTLFLSDIVNTKVEVTNAGPADLKPSDVALWVTLTSAAIIKLDSTYTAIRITNTGSGAIIVNLAI